MDPTNELDTCADCGGVVRPVASLGRLRHYRGEPGYEIPASLAIPTCEQCGALWMDHSHLEQIEAAFAAQYTARRARALARTIGKSVAVDWLAIVPMGPTVNFLAPQPSVRCLSAVTKTEAIAPSRIPDYFISHKGVHAAVEVKSCLKVPYAAAAVDSLFGAFVGGAVTGALVGSVGAVLRAAVVGYAAAHVAPAPMPVLNDEPDPVPVRLGASSYRRPALAS